VWKLWKGDELIMNSEIDSTCHALEQVGLKFVWSVAENSKIVAVFDASSLKHEELKEIAQALCEKEATINVGVKPNNGKPILVWVVRV